MVHPKSQYGRFHLLLNLSKKRFGIREDDKLTLIVSGRKYTVRRSDIIRVTDKEVKLILANSKVISVGHPKSRRDSANQPPDGWRIGSVDP